MEYKYKIVSRDSTKIVNLIDLSRNLKMNSDIFSIENDKEITLGLISHKSLVYIAIENASYSLQHYAKKKIPEAENCINLVKKWIEDSSSVSNEELKAAADAANTYNAYAAANTASTASNAAAFAVNLSFNATANAAAQTAAYVGMEEEFIRQGNFILDYLKSNLYLFHLEK
jgi:hypothetical protein